MRIIFSVLLCAIILATPSVVSAQNVSDLELQIQGLLKRIAELQAHVTKKSADVGIVELSITPAQTVPSQNIYRGLNKQVFGGFDVVVRGESLVIDNILFMLEMDAGSVRDVALYNGRGDMILGPGIVTGNTVSFNKPLTLTTGNTVIVLRGTLDEGVVNNSTFTSVARVERWRAKGSITGRIVALPSSDVSGNPMTIVSAGLSVTAHDKVPQGAVADGTPHVVFGEYTFSAKNSPEPVKVEKLSLLYTVHEGSLFAIRGCALYDKDGEVLMEGRSFVTPRESNKLFTLPLSPPIIVATSSDITITLACSVEPHVSGSVSWRLIDSSRVTAYGLRSGSVVTAGIVPQKEVRVDIDATRHSLVSHWGFDTDGSNIVDDVGRNNGVLKEATSTIRVQGEFEKALMFDGEREYVEIPHTDSLRMQSGSLVFTIKPNANSGVFFSKGDLCVHECISLSLLDGAVLLEQGNKTRKEEVISGGSLATSTWSQVVIQFNLQGTTLYINGDRVAESPRVLSMQNNRYPIYFGGVPNHSYFDGLMDDVRIYNRVLTDAEIKRLSDGLTQVFAGGSFVESLFGSVISSFTQKASLFSSVISLFSVFGR